MGFNSGFKGLIMKKLAWSVWTWMHLSQGSVQWVAVLNTVMTHLLQ